MKWLIYLIHLFPLLLHFDLLTPSSIGWESSTNYDITDQFTCGSPELHTIDDLAAVKNDTLLDRNQTV